MQYRLLVLVVSILTALMGASAAADAGTTSSIATSTAYDSRTIAQVDVHQFRAGVGLGQQSSGARGEPASTSVEARGTSTTPSTRSHATNTAGGLYDDVLQVSDDALQGLSTSERRAVQSLQTQIESHQQKLADYIANPDAYDNLGFLQNAPTEQIRQQIIQGRIGHLEHEMSTFADQIRKILGGG